MQKLHILNKIKAGDLVKKKFTTVFIISVILAIIFIVWGAFAPNNLENVSTTIQTFLQEKFGWFYLISATGMLLFVIYLAFSKYGKIKLGKDDDEQEYSTFSWFARLFSAGMGVGLVFCGVAEAVSRYFNPACVDGGAIHAA